MRWLAVTWRHAARSRATSTRPWSVKIDCSMNGAVFAAAGTEASPEADDGADDGADAEADADNDA
jgi:hypothetical protein